MSFRRRAAVLLFSAALLVAALHRSDEHASDPASASVVASTPAPRTHRLAPSEALRRTASGFLKAFLAYEVGDRRQVLARRLRATSTKPFASQLLAEPRPRTAISSSPRAPISDLDVAVMGGHPSVASVTATARRPSGPEQLSFVFICSRGRWLASAPGE
jgi:hypothetical protein